MVELLLAYEYDLDSIRPLFILPLGGSFLFSKNFLPTPSLTGELVMPIRRTTQKRC